MTQTGLERRGLPATSALWVPGLKGWATTSSLSLVLMARNQTQTRLHARQSLRDTEPQPITTSFPMISARFKKNQTNWLWKDLGINWRNLIECKR